MTSNPKPNYKFPLAILTILFFAWGFITALNDVLIPYFKNVFELTTVQSTLVQMAFFGAYFFGSLIYFLISSASGDPIAKIGYKNGLLLGLFVSAAGCAMFYPAAVYHVYGFFLGALFTLGLGLTLLQIAANPYVALLGSPETASARLNLSQGLNSFGTTVSPVIGGIVIFEYFHADTGGAEAVKIPYLLLAGGFILLAGMIKMVKLPQVQVEDDHAGEGGSALKYPNLVFGMFAIFCYVGAEVSIGSLLVNYLGLPETAGLEEAAASKYLAFYWGGVMIGRFMGSVSMSQTLENTKKIGLMILIALSGYALVTVLSGVSFISSWPFFSFAGVSFSQTWPFLIFAALNLVVFQISKGIPNRILLLFAFFASLMLLFSYFNTGNVAMWAVISIGLFNSIMWSNIFTLSIAGLGKDTSQGSSLLVMMILGGAVVPPLQGLIAGNFDLKLSFLFPIVCYIYLMYFGWKGYKPKGQ